MTEWQKAPFTEVIDFQEGPGILAKDFRSTGVPLVRLSGLDAGASVIDGCNYLDAEMVAKKWAHFGLAEGDILLSTSASLGRVVTVNAEGVGAIPYTGIMRMRPRNERVYAPYIRYMLESPEFQKQAGVAGGGSVLKHFGPMHLKHMYVHLPSLGEQKTITAVLASIDAKIDLNNRINAELEALAKTIYDYWFVQFDFPDAKGRPYKFSGGKMVWNEALKREIPVGWEAVVIGQECETILGGTPHTKNPDYWDNADIPWLSSGETARFPVLTSEQKITAAGIRDSAAKLLPAGTVVVSIVRYIRPSILGIAAATNQSVAGILETAQFPSSFLYPAVCREVPRWMTLRTGAQQPHINKATIDDTLLVRAPEGVIDAYRKVADPLFNRIFVAANENIELTQLRDWLLPLLMNGQVRVA